MCSEPTVHFLTALLHLALKLYISRKWKRVKLFIELCLFCLQHNGIHLTAVARSLCIS